MLSRLSQARWPRPLWPRSCWSNAGCILAAATLLGAQIVHSQEPPPDLLAPQAAVKQHNHGKQKPQDTPGPKPTAEISLEQLGFASPSVFHLGDRWVQSSLCFLDEDHLLFTFRVPGLIARDHASSDSEASKSASEGRNIRALVLDLPSGRVEAEALWHLHDYASYLWPLSGGRFLLRDRNLLQIGDASLHLEPYLRFPGTVKYLEFDPRQTMLVTQNLEPSLEGIGPDTQSSETHASDSPGSDPHGAEMHGSIAGNLPANSHPVPGSSAASASVLPLPTLDTHRPSKTDLVSYLRIFRMSDRKILTTSRIPEGTVHVAIDQNGYYDVQRAGATTWQILYRGFEGSESLLDQVQSSCTPPLDVLAPNILLVSACDDSGGRRLTVLTRDMRHLWQTQSSSTHVWPLLVTSANGLRLARATLDVTHAITGGMPLEDPSEIHGQTIQVFDVATGKVAITGPAKPVLDGGGNFTLSPSGNRFAVLNNGAIQIYDLNPAPPLPTITPVPPRP